MVLPEIITGVCITILGYCVLKFVIDVGEGCVIFCENYVFGSEEEKIEEREMDTFV